MEEAARLRVQDDKAVADEEKPQRRAEENTLGARAATIEEDQRAARDRNFSSAGEVQATRAEEQSLVGARQAGRWNLTTGYRTYRK